LKKSGNAETLPGSKFTPETQIDQNFELRDDKVLCFTITNQKYEK